VNEEAVVRAGLQSQEKKKFHLPPSVIANCFAGSPKTTTLGQICALLGFYAAQNGSFLPTFRVSRSVPTSRVKQSKNLTLENETDRLSRNIGKILHFFTAQKFQNSADLIYTAAEA
jgi:hypothetical protein